MAITINYGSSSIGTLNAGQIATLNTAATKATDNIIISDTTIAYTGNYTTTLIPLGISKPTSLVTTTYNGSNQNNGYTTPANVILTGSVSGINAGDYVAIYTPNTGYCWNDGTRDAVSITLRINPKSISGATVTLGNSLTYRIIPQTQLVSSVTIDGFNATYTVSNNVQSDAGNYTLTCTGTGNFTGTQTKSWSIARATIDSFSLSNGTAKTYNGSTLSVTVGTVRSGSMSATYSTSGTYSATTVGTYTATVAGTGNYLGTLNANWTINRLYLSIPYLSNASYTYDGGNKAPTINNFNSTWENQSGTTSAINVGSWTITWSLKDTSNTWWSDGSTSNKSGSWSIARASVGSKPSGQTYSYDGGTKTPYSNPYVSCISGTASASVGGSYSATYRVDGNHCWSDGTTSDVSISWTIQYVWNKYNSVQYYIEDRVTDTYGWFDWHDTNSGITWYAHGGTSYSLDSNTGKFSLSGSTTSSYYTVGTYSSLGRTLSNSYYWGSLTTSSSKPSTFNNLFYTGVYFGYDQTHTPYIVYYAINGRSYKLYSIVNYSKGSTSYGTVASTSSSAYPENGRASDGYWYVKTW